MRSACFLSWQISNGDGVRPLSAGSTPPQCIRSAACHRPVHLEVGSLRQNLSRHRLVHYLDTYNSPLNETMRRGEYPKAGIIMTVNTGRNSFNDASHNDVTIARGSSQAQVHDSEGGIFPSGSRGLETVP